MTALNFPSSPPDGFQYVDGKIVYTYSAATGLWSRGLLGTALPQNLIVNPQMATSQENDVTGGTTSGFYAADQWRMLETLATGVVTGSRLLSAGANGSPYRIRTLVSTAQAAIGAAEYAGLLSYVEGNRIAPLKWGTTYAIPAVLRFWAASVPAGMNYTVTIRNNPATHRISFPFAPTASWTQFSFAIPSPVGQTWTLDSTVGLELWFVAAAGANHAGAAFTGQWMTGSAISLLGQGNGVATVSNQMVISDVGLYPDPLGTGIGPIWDAVPNMDSDMDCLRYWYRLMGSRGVANSATSAGRMGQQHPVEMRIGATIANVGAPTAYDGTNNGALTMGATYPNTRFADFTGSTTTLVAGRGVMQSQPAGAYVAVSARM